MDFAESSQSTRVHDAMSHAAALYQGGARTGVGLTHHQQQFLEGLIRQKKQELARNQQGKSEK